MGSEEKEGECWRRENIPKREDAIIAPSGGSVPGAGTDQMPFWKKPEPKLMSSSHNNNNKTQLRTTGGGARFVYITCGSGPTP